jgi:nucleoside-diphosphate kinase
MITDRLASVSVGGVVWADWTVVLLKPDCLARGLVQPILDWVATRARLVDVRQLAPTQAQIFAHYDDMLPLSREIGRDVPAELRRIFVGNTVTIALGHGRDAAARVRALVGPTDPAIAPKNTIRGRYAEDTLARAMADGRLVDNLIHTSDHGDVVERDVRIWYGPAGAALLGVPDLTNSAPAVPRPATPVSIPGQSTVPTV